MAIDLLKKCPLLISVLLTSLLVPWELFQNDTSSMASEEAPKQTVTTTDTTTVTTSGLPVVTTTKQPSAAPMTTADESYFEDALFIGNSRTVGLYLFGDMPESTDFFADIGLNIYDAMEDSIEVPPESGSYSTLSEVLAEKQYGKIYLMFGINELGIGTSQSFADYYRTVVDQICEMQPDAFVYVQSIINVATFAEDNVINNANINEKNALLAEIADNEQVFYINVNENLTDASGGLDADYTSDGIHLGGGSLPYWKETLLANAMQKSAPIVAAPAVTTTTPSEAVEVTETTLEE